MFKFAKKREVLWPVTIMVPVDDGKTAEQQFTVRFRLMTKSEMTDALAETVDEDMSKVFAAQDARLVDHVVGWSGLVDETGDELPFTSSALNALLDVPYVRSAIEGALWEASRGAPAKNSSPGHVG